MPDLTARNAVRNCFCPAAWCRAHGCPTRRCTAKADAVLAALGIPPDTTTDTIHAGLAALRILADGIDRYSTTPLRLVKCEGGYQAYRPVYRGECGTPSASPAAAVLALANKLQEHK